MRTLMFQKDLKEKKIHPGSSEMLQHLRATSDQTKDAEQSFPPGWSKLGSQWISSTNLIKIKPILESHTCQRDSAHSTNNILQCLPTKSILSLEIMHWKESTKLNIEWIAGVFTFLRPRLLVTSADWSMACFGHVSVDAVDQEALLNWNIGHGQQAGSNPVGNVLLITRVMNEPQKTLPTRHVDLSQYGSCFSVILLQMGWIMVGMRPTPCMSAPLVI